MRFGRGLSIAAAFIVFAGVVYVAKEYPDAGFGPSKEERAEQQLEHAFSRSELRAFYEVFRKEFPEEYAELVRTASKLIAAGASPSRLTEGMATFTDNLRRTQAEHVGQAELARLDKIMLNQLAIAEKLQSVDVALCSKFLVEALSTAEQRKHSEVIPLMANASTVTLEAIADGRRRQLTYEKSTEADWQMVTELMIKRGAGENDLLLMDPAEAAKVGPERVCTTGLSMLSAMLALETEPRGRVLSELVTLMAKQ